MQLKVGGKYKNGKGALVTIESTIPPSDGRYSGGFRFLDTNKFSYMDDGRFESFPSLANLIEEVDTNMKYELGKYYRDINNNKCQILCTTGCTVSNGVAYPIIAKVHSGSVHLIIEYTPSGRALGPHHDLLDEWSDFKFDWSCLPAWAKEIAQYKNGQWGWTIGTYKFTDCGSWDSDNTTGRIPSEYAPTYTGDWKDSRRVRPTTPQ